MGAAEGTGQVPADAPPLLCLVGTLMGSLQASHPAEKMRDLRLGDGKQAAWVPQ